MLSRTLMVLTVILCSGSFAQATLLAPGCYLEFNRCIAAGGSRLDCYPAFVSCVDGITTYAVGFDGPLGKYGMAAVRPVVAGEEIDITAGRYDFGTESYLPGPGAVTGVTFMYVRTDELFANGNTGAVEWTEIGPGSFNPATNQWEISWTVPGGPAPQGYEVAAVMHDPTAPNGANAGGFHAELQSGGSGLIGSDDPAPVITPGDIDPGKAHSFSNNLSAAPQIYPVPASQQLTLQWTVPMTAEYAIVVSDMLGREVMQILPPTRLESGKTAQRFDIAALPPGQYVYRIHSSTMSHTGKFLKE